MQAPRMRVGVYGDTRLSTLPDQLAQVGHDVYYLDYDPDPPSLEELDMVILEVRESLLEAAVEKLAERSRRGQIFVHTSLSHGVQIMDPLEVTGAVVMALGELGPQRWAVTTVDEVGDTISDLLVGEIGASGFHFTDAERLRAGAAVTYVRVVHTLRQDAVRLLSDVLGTAQEASDIADTLGTLRHLPDVAGLRAQWEAIDNPGQARAFRQASRRVAETQHNQDVELWAIQEEKL
ncbi:6PGD fold domain-containing protein [Corynebacterium comes]|uniref:Rossmann-like domain protein n=1 Tax=Corynebacterium comes TaxID=2675218 RepID=A0A6B8VNE7_9CORY|nr:hypothetical protein [Corynebacterium comes]QGU05553.1 Rossmann-like domain protein [Corynebacterium comes]